MTVQSRAGSMRVLIAQITSCQSRTFTSLSGTITNLVYMNWRRKLHTPNITRLACPGRSFLLLTPAARRAGRRASPRRPAGVGTVVNRAVPMGDARDGKDRETLDLVVIAGVIA